MAGAGRGKEKASLNPYFAGGGGERGTFSGLIAISLIFFSSSSNPPLLLLLLSPLSSLLFFSQAPAPSNRTERYEVPLGGRSHPSQLGGVAFDRGQSHHQRFQYDRESWYRDVYPVRHIQWLGVRCMIRRRGGKKRETHKNKQKEKYLQGKWTWEEERKKRLMKYLGWKKRTDWYKY